MADKAIDDIFAQLMGEAGQEEESSKVASDEALKVAGANLSQEELGVLNSFLEEHEEDEKRAEEEKVAEEAFVQGRIMAQGFIAELDKIAADGGYDTSTAVADPSTQDLEAGAAKGGVPNPSEESTVVKQTKKEDAIKSPKSPTTSQDVVKVVKKVVQAANAASKGQAPQEVPNNLGQKETASKGNNKE